MKALQLEQLDQVDRWLRAVLWDQKLPETDRGLDFEVHRSKGRLVFQDGPVRLLQGVREVFDITEAPPSDEPAPTEGKIIFIGRGLGSVDFEDSLRKALAT